MRPALFFVLIVSLAACGAVTPGAAPVAPAASAIVEGEISLEVSALM